MNIDDESEAVRDAVTYDIYLRLHAAQDLYPAKTLRTVLSELFYADPFAWRAVGITRAALDAYRNAGKDRIKGIERAHLTDRHRMVAHILKRDAPMSKDELFSYWRTEDRVVISLKSENRSNQLVILPVLTGRDRRTHAAIFSFMAGVTPPMPMFGRSLL